MIKWKHIEAMREIRLWIGQIIVPAGLGCAIIFSDPETREKVASKVRSVKESIKEKISRH